MHCQAQGKTASDSGLVHHSSLLLAIYLISRQVPYSKRRAGPEHKTRSALHFSFQGPTGQMTLKGLWGARMTHNPKFTARPVTATELITITIIISYARFKPFYLKFQKKVLCRFTQALRIEVAAIQTYYVTDLWNWGRILYFSVPNPGPGCSKPD